MLIREYKQLLWENLGEILAIESESQFDAKKNRAPLSNSVPFRLIERLKAVMGTPDNSLK